MSPEMILRVENKHERFLKDESAEQGFADSISFPQSEEDVIRIMQKLHSEGVGTVTVQGAMTGIGGAAVPHGGHIMNMTHMDKVIGSGKTDDGTEYIKVQPGITLKSLKAEIARRFRSEKLFWPPSPSEDTATVGGIVASGAFGMNAGGYGETRKYVASATCINGLGEKDTLHNQEDLDEHFASDRSRYPVTELSLRLIRSPEAVWGIAFFFNSGEDAAACADSLASFTPCPGTGMPVMELITGRAVEMACTMKGVMGASWTVPDIPEGASEIIYVEIEGNEDAIEETVMELAEAVSVFGSDPDKAWALSGETEIGKMHLFRHAVTEGAVTKMAGINADSKGLHLVSSDITGGIELPGTAALNCVKKLRSMGVDAAVCCSLGVPVLRVILIPETQDELIKGMGFKEDCMKGEKDE